MKLVDEDILKVNGRANTLSSKVKKVSLRFKEFDLKNKYKKREKQIYEGNIWNVKVDSRIQKLLVKLKEKQDMRISKENEQILA